MREQAILLTPAPSSAGRSRARRRSPLPSARTDTATTSRSSVRVVAGQRPNPNPTPKTAIPDEKPGINYSARKRFKQLKLGTSDPIQEDEYKASLDLPLVIACRCGWREEGIARDVLALQAEHKAVCVGVRELVAA